MIVSLLHTGASASAGDVTATSEAEGPSVPRASALDAVRETFHVTMRLCRVHLMRDLVYKGQTFSPFIPTKQTLLLFPCSIETTTRAELAPGAKDKMGLFLTLLYSASGGSHFTIVGAMLCTVSGSAALILESDSIDAAFALQDACHLVNQRSPEARMASLFVGAFPCQYLSEEEVLTDAQRRELLQDLYSVPSCSLCAERLELSLTGMGDSQESPVCGCFAAAGNSVAGAASPPRSCACLTSSTCVVCQQLLSAQLTRSSGQPQVRCQECRQSGDPWICMICGYVGCSRYQAMHAKEHFLRSSHFFSINLLTQQVWDYQSDAFVHRAMFLVDAKSGKATKLQYPGRVDSPTAALLNDDRGHADLGGGGSGGSAFPRETHVDAVAEKKVVSGKYDAKLTTSHTQYATALKNELDAMRTVYVENAWLAIRSMDPTTKLTKDEVSRLLEHATVVLPGKGKETDSGDGDGGEDITASQNPADNNDMEREEALYYDTLFNAQEPLVAALVAKHQEERAMAYGVQHLEHELNVRQQESISLQEVESALTSEMRAVVQKNVMVSLELNNAIEELQETLREIDLNVATQRRLKAKMGSKDDAARMVVMGQGRDSEKGSGSGANGKSRSSKK